jgi:osmotically-inducible protein OsmY
VTQVLVDPASGAATHVVVRYPVGLLKTRDVVVPLSWASSVTPERLVLAVRRDDLDHLPEYRPDEEIRDEVLLRLHADPRFQGVDFDALHVEVAGGVVRLGGHVRRMDLKSAAERIAAGVPGVLSVESLMVADDQLQAAVERAVHADPALEPEGLAITVLLGVVTLEGSVRTPELREGAERAARRVPGVEGVVNRLGVRQSETEDEQGGMTHERQEARS